MTSFRRAQIPLPGLKERKCSEHVKQAIIMACKTCKGKLVCTKCITSAHNGHNLIEFEDLIEEKKSEMKEKLRASVVESNLLTKMLDNIGQMKRQNEDRTRSAVEMITQRRNAMISDIERIANKLEDACKTKEKSTAEILSRVEKDIENVQEVSKVIKEKCEEAVHSESLWKILDISYDEIGSLTPDYTMLEPDIGNVEFEPGSFQIKESDFGNLVFAENKPNTVAESPPKNKGQRAKMPLPPPPKPKPKAGTLERITTEPETYNPERPKLERVYSAPENQIYVATVKEVGKFSIVSEGVYTICPIAHNQAWIAYFLPGKQLTSNITLVDDNGQMITSTPVGAQVKDVVVTHDRSLIASCKGGMVKRLYVGSTISSLFGTQFSQSGLCLTMDGNIVVCFCDSGLVIRYTTTGEIVSLLSTEKTGIAHPYKINLDSNTGGFVITDKSTPSKVFILNSNLEVKYVYNGKTTYRPGIDAPSTSDDPTTSFNEACFDKNGDILVSGIDSVSGFLIKLNSQGAFLSRLLNFGRIGPYSVSCGPDGKLWVGFQNGNVILYQ